MPGIDEDLTFKPIGVAVLTVSDTRTVQTDTSGDILAARVEAAGHRLADRALLKDEASGLSAKITEWAARKDINAIVTTGGTGLTGRDVTVEAVRPLFSKEIDGFAVIFHMVSFQSVGLSTLASRACAGIVNGTYVFCLPGSSGAVKDGWDKVIAFQLDSRHRPCNLVDIIPRLTER